MENLTTCPTCKGEKIIVRKNKVGNEEVVNCPTCEGSGILATSQQVNNQTIFNLESFDFNKKRY